MFTVQTNGPFKFELINGALHIELPKTEVDPFASGRNYCEFFLTRENVFDLHAKLGKAVEQWKEHDRREAETG